jgi:hypothetical protein
MDSTLKPKQTDDPHDFLVVAQDDVRVAPSDEELSNLLRNAARHLSDPQTHRGSDVAAGPSIPPVDTTFRPAAVENVLVPGPRRSIGRRAVRAFAALLLAGCIGVAAMAWQSRGDVAKRAIAKWTPNFVLTSSLPTETPGLSAQSTPPAIQAAVANAAPPQPAPLAQTAAEGVAPTAALSPDSAQLLQTMARDLATVAQEIEQLKASIEQLKAGQAQMSRELAKNSEPRNSEPSPRPRASANPPRPVASIPPRPAPRRPRQAYLPPPAVITSSQPSYAVPPALPPLPPVTSQPMASQPMPLPEAATASDDGPVIRPPMPLR